MLRQCISRPSPLGEGLGVGLVVRRYGTCCALYVNYMLCHYNANN